MKEVVGGKILCRNPFDRQRRWIEAVNGGPESPNQFQVERDVVPHSDGIYNTACIEKLRNDRPSTIDRTQMYFSGVNVMAIYRVSAGQ
jgi:hypothetical protein